MIAEFYPHPKSLIQKASYERKNDCKRHSWDTCIKHSFRLGIENHIPSELRAGIPSSNISRWKRETGTKYKGCELADFITQEIDLIKRINQSSNIKKVIEGYFKLSDVFNYIISDVKGIKSLIKNNMEVVVDTIEQIKDSVLINHALKIFNISRATYQNYKTITIHKCEASYFKWCTKKIPNQLLSNEVFTIKKYMEHENYKFWSKSSIYLKAIRDNSLHCGLSTFYKYCRLLGFANLSAYPKQNNYCPLKSSKPNEVWCADVTVFKTVDGSKHYIHVLMDHFSKRILGYRVEKSSSGKAIRGLLQDAFLRYRPTNTLLLTDGGSENVNTDVGSLIDSFKNSLLHKIAQRDVLFSNSMIEAFNKVLKYQFLYPQNIGSGKQLEKIMVEAITIYNNVRPQWQLGGNTPSETFNGTPIDFSKYTGGFKNQMAVRMAQNKNSSCKKCP